MCNFKVVIINRLLRNIGFLFLLQISFIHAQTSCTKNKLIGDWIYVRSSLDFIDTIIKKNLEILMDNSKPDINSIWTFDSITCKRSLQKNKAIKYRIDEKNCRIIYGKRENPPSQKISFILYLDEKYLVLKKPNPHAYSIFYFKRRLPEQ